MRPSGAPQRPEELALEREDDGIDRLLTTHHWKGTRARLSTGIQRLTVEKSDGKSLEVGHDAPELPQAGQAIGGKGVSESPLHG
jgi:hypothetical protein